MTRRKIGKGTISLLLTFMGVLWGFTLWDACIGDNILKFMGLRAWGDTGVHYTAYYSLVFLLPAFLLGMKYKSDFGAAMGKITSVTIGVILVFSTLFLTR